MVINVTQQHTQAFKLSLVFIFFFQDSHKFIQGFYRKETFFSAFDFFCSSSIQINNVYIGDEINDND